jgi:hypothetical protein
MGDIISFFGLVVKIYEQISGKQKDKIIAMGAIRKAFNYTYNYLYNIKGSYKPNMHLADLWNEASTEVMKVDKRLGKTFASKSRFWAHPDIYIELNRDREIITLKEVVDEMERLQKAIR